MFWKKKTEDSEPPGHQQPNIDSTRELDRALDSLASVIRSFGEHAFDTDLVEAKDTRAACDGWASRILVGEARHRDTDDEDEAPDPRGFRRDYAGVRRFVEDHRVHEREYVTRGMSNLREAVQTFARCISTTVQEDRAADGVVGAQLGKLVGAFTSNDSTAIRQEAEAIAETLTAIMVQRRAREQRQLEQLGETVRELKEELRDARERAALDQLTQLYNRAALDEHLERVSDLSFILASTPSVLMIDVDHFKAINDAHGHQTGDLVLKRVADTLVRNFLRKEDFVARYGGEEFVVVIPDSSLHNAEERAQRVRQMVEDLSIQVAGRAIPVAISIGIACLEPGDEAATWLARADAALYEAKASGRNRVVVAPRSNKGHSLGPNSAAPPNRHSLRSRQSGAHAAVQGAQWQQQQKRRPSAAQRLPLASSSKTHEPTLEQIPNPEIVSVRTNPGVFIEPVEPENDLDAPDVAPLSLGSVRLGEKTERSDSRTAKSEGLRPLTLPSVSPERPIK